MAKCFPISLPFLSINLTKKSQKIQIVTAKQLNKSFVFCSNCKLNQGAWPDRIK